MRNAKELDTLEAEIVALETTLVEAQRRAGDLVGDELAYAIADAEACCARLRLDQFYRIYFRVAREARSSPRRDESGSSLIVDLQATAAAVEEGRANNVDPATTLRILHATRRTA